MRACGCARTPGPCLHQKLTTANTKYGTNIKWVLWYIKNNKKYLIWHQISWDPQHSQSLVGRQGWRTEAKRLLPMLSVRTQRHLPYQEQWRTAWPLLAHRPPLTQAKLHKLSAPLPVSIPWKGAASPLHWEPCPRADPQPPTPNFPLRPSTPSTEAYRTLPRLLIRQNNTLLMIKSAATSFVDFCRNFARERMAGHDSELTEWHLIFSKPSSDCS